MKSIKNSRATLLVITLILSLLTLGSLIFRGNFSVSAAPTKVNDDGAGISYTGSWTDSSTATGYYNNDCHWSFTNGAYAQFTFTGTIIRWIGGKNTDHGFAKVYLDGNLDATLDTYSSTWLAQQVLYEKTGLTSGSHTIKVEVTNTKNSNSTNYFQDIDAFEYDNVSATTTPTPSPTPTPTVTPTPGGSTWTRVNDTDPGATYTTGVTFSSAMTGYYNGDAHFSNLNGNYCQYTFTGTGVRWIGAKNNDHGYADIYLDGALQTSLSTYASSWLKIQTLYEKTGLTNSSHTLKITVTGNKESSSSGYYQDWDAFEYFGAAAATPTPFPNLTLPTPVPHYGAHEKNFLGSGMAGAGGDVSGVWDFLIGPDYTSPDFINSETLSLIVDGTPQSLSLEMYRGRKTGLFYGTQQIGDLKVYLIDYTNDNSPWVARMVKVDNTSGSTAHNVQVKAVVTPQGGTTGLVNGDSVSILMDTNQWCFGNVETRNWANRSSLITFNDTCTAIQNGSNYEITTVQRPVAPSTNLAVALYHYQHYDETGVTNTDYINYIKARNIKNDVDTCVNEWNTWIDAGNMYSSQITDQKARDVVEGSLLAVKMQQNQDGGTIAGTRKYANSYVRDSHGGARLLGITGHYNEVKKIIQNLNQKWQTAGFIPNWWSMGSDAFIGHSFNNDASEVTAYYVFMIRDYYSRTNDLAFVDSVYNSMKWAIDAQLNFMQNNGWRIDFNGDETEQYTCKYDGQEYGGFPALTGWNNRNWSYPSCVAAATSTKFFIDYLNIKGNTTLANDYQTKMNNVLSAIDTTFWRTDLSPNIHDWARKTDNSWFSYRVTNYGTLPLWMGAVLNSNRQNGDALAMKAYLNPTTGYLPTAPGDTEGFCGHNLALLLFDLKKLNDSKAVDVYNTIMNSNLLGCWGTVSEFYGPNGTPNGHNYRVFESGPNGEAIIRYFIGF